MLFVLTLQHCHLKQHNQYYFARLIIHISKQETIYIDEANSGAGIDLLHGFVGNTHHIGTQQS